MSTHQPSWTWRGCTLRPARHEDAEAYFHHNFAPLDAEVTRLTGSRTDFTHDEVVGFFHRCVDAEDRLAALKIRQLDGDAPVEAAGTQQRRIERLGAVGRGQYDHAL